MHLEVEREQMLAHWSRIFKRNPCWFTAPPPQLGKVLSRDVVDRGMAIRKFHDKLGFCAKGSVRTGGLCAGSIFRTSSFIGLAQEDRSGARATQTVHIEHTVPAKVLARELEKQISTAPDGSPDAGLAWLLKHSVTTAMKKGQDKDYLRGVTRTTTAFDEGAVGAGLPFMRYATLFQAGEQVWDVWNRAAVHPQELTFDNHLSTILSILRKAGADATFINRIERAA